MGHNHPVLGCYNTPPSAPRRVLGTCATSAPLPASHPSGRLARTHTPRSPHAAGQNEQTLSLRGLGQHTGVDLALSGGEAQVRRQSPIICFLGSAAFLHVALIHHLMPRSGVCVTSRSTSKEWTTQDALISSVAEIYCAITKGSGEGCVKCTAQGLIRIDV